MEMGKLRLRFESKDNVVGWMINLKVDNVVCTCRTSGGEGFMYASLLFMILSYSSLQHALSACTISKLIQTPRALPNMLQEVNSNMSSVVVVPEMFLFIGSSLHTPLILPFSAFRASLSLLHIRDSLLFLLIANTNHP